MKIIAGLGNPTAKYDKTRHNVGFAVIDALSDKYGIDVSGDKFKAFCGTGFIEGEKVLLLKPLTYMNLSGESIVAAMNYYKAELSDLIVISDDIDLDIGKLRIRKKGSAGGHNGLKNIILHLGADTFARVKVGIGAKPKGMDLADYVLSHFHGEEEVIMKEAYNRAAEAVGVMLKSGVDTAMNQYN